MTALEAGLITLGTAAVRTAAKLWLGDRAIAAEVTASAVDVMSGKLSSMRDRRRLERTMDSFADAVVERIEPIVATEFRGMAENERLAALDALATTFSTSALTDADLFAADLDAGHLDRAIRGRVPDPTTDLSEDGTAFYDLLLRECCGYVIEIARGLPRYTPTALTELLRRDTEILDGIREVLRRLPQRGRGSGFGYDYRQLIARTLDHAELFGVTTSDASRRYPLSVAYISLSAVGDAGESLTQSRRVEALLAGNRRVFVRGEAGLGKTTLLQWIAVRSALNDFSGALSAWNNDTMPFFLPLRRYADRPLPTAEQFLDEVGRHIADEMPEHWVRERMRNGTGLLLVDGVDELPAARRNEVREWLRDLIRLFPDARYVVTSRPSAARPTWLSGEEFTVLDLQPMSPADVEVFVQRWHSAMRAQCADDDARTELDKCQKSLLDRITSRGHLRKLARYPLLCALLCALNRDRRSAMPSNRMELYDVALQMLLERLDDERHIYSLDGLGRTEKVLLLGDLAYWLIRNSASDADTERVVSHFAERLKSMPQIKHDAETVFHHLLDRTGLLRKPVEDRVDFIHRTFQEYLAARDAVQEADDVGALVANAEHDQWQEVVVMAVGHASSGQRKELLRGLLDRGDANPSNRGTFHLLALAGLETAPELDAQLWRDIEQRAAQLVPPQSLAAAKSLANAGAFVLDMLAAANPVSEQETIATIRAAAETGLDEALPVIAGFHGDTRLAVQEELLNNWPAFDADDYAREVLFDLREVPIDVVDPDTLSACRHIRNLRTIGCSNARTIEEAVMPSQVERLVLRVTEPVDLSALRASGLRDVEIEAQWDTLDVDLAPLAEISGLEVLRLKNVSLRTRTLDSMVDTSVRRLDLRSVSAAEVAGIRPGWRLDELRLAEVIGLEDLTDLRFAGLRALHISKCHQLSWLTGITRWAETLVELTVLHSDGIYFDDRETLAVLSKLPLLERLTIRTAATFDSIWVGQQLESVSVDVSHEQSTW